MTAGTLLKRHAAFFFLFLATLLFTTLILTDAESWYYSAIGDEYSFYNLAQKISTGEVRISLLPHQGTMSVFSQQGVYDVVPIAGSVYQAIILKIYGLHHLAWIISSVFIIIATTWFFYFLLKGFVGERIALIAVILFLSSHYIWGFTHLGYWNIHVLLIPLAALFFLEKGTRKKSMRILFLCGIFTGLSFYTYFTARIIIIFLLILTALNLKTVLRKKQILISFLPGFFLTSLPFFLVNGSFTVSQMFDRSTVGSKEIPPAGKFSQGLLSMWRSFFAFYQNQQTSHFVSGSLIDSVTGIFFVIGIVLAFFSFKKFSIIFLWFFLSLLVVAGFSPYLSIPLTRLLFLIPFFVFFAALAIDASSERLEKDFGKRAGNIFIASILLLVLFFNLHRFYLTTPTKLDLTPETLAIRELSISLYCQKKSIVVYPKFESVLLPALQTHGLSNRVLLLKTLDKIPSTFLSQTGCIIFPGANDANAFHTLGTLKTLKAFTGHIIRSPSKTTSIVVFNNNSVSKLK